MKRAEKDKRELQRFAMEIPARIRVLDSNQGELDFDIKTSNISSGGAFFYTTEHLREGTDVTIELFLPIEKLIKYLENCLKDYGNTLIKLSGKVLRSEPEGMAIRFNKDYRISPLKGAPHN